MILSQHTLSILLLALIIDRIIGDPDWLWSRVPHPVVLIGRLIGQMDKTLNKAGHDTQSVRQKGYFVAGFLVLLALVSGVLLHLFLQPLPFGSVAEAVLAAFLIAHKSLLDHLYAVSRAIRDAGIDAGRTAVGRIVGRDTTTMDEAAISRASIESAAENFSDGVIAPAFWLLLCGLPGLLIYKAVNTADSMIGHKSERYIQFGYASARLDDFLSYIPARLTGLLIALVAPIMGGNSGKSFLVMRADAPGHVSPNAGWPEAAMAGALNVSLGGPRSYGDTVVKGAWINSGGQRTINRQDIIRSAKLLDFAWLFFTALLAVIFVIVRWL